ncbi:uncharacterized protein ALTATR162_LOCUS11432 [Alternaria atra]|uniref:Uncharacterized protein n=1 Tax=Alternaria atra TaxID=119953 RepID=A0A8J2IFM4_9PLEO|nr:uncharacterized protein ALTATR162_LOCUS11432 [Alternaria atra]CAG5185902.1 unnamed protein product [Alternaria atra]
MVALPTLRPQHDMPASPKYSAADTFLAAIDAEVNVTDNTQTVSTLHPHGVVLSLDPLFGNDDYDQTHLSPSQGHDHMAAPTDGGSVWYCSNCRDGPLGDWQNVCTACSHVKGHPLPPSFWWNESTICNEYYLRAEYVTENASFTLNPVVVHQLRFSPSVPEQGLLPTTALVPAPPIRFERKSRPSTPEPSKERRAPLKRLKTGLRGGSKEEEASSTSLLVLSAPSQYRVGATSKIKLSLQATLSDGDTQPAPVYLRGIRAQAIAHINFRIPLASAPNEE